MRAPTRAGGGRPHDGDPRAAPGPGPRCDAAARLGLIAELLHVGLPPAVGVHDGGFLPRHATPVRPNYG